MSNKTRNTEMNSVYHISPELVEFAAATYSLNYDAGVSGVCLHPHADLDVERSKIYEITEEALAAFESGAIVEIVLIKTPR